MRVQTPSGDFWFQLTPTVAVTSYHGLQPGSSGWDSPGKNTGVGCHALLQGIFPTQGSNLCLLSPVLADGLLTTSADYLPPKRQTSERNKWQRALIYSDVIAWLVLLLFVCVCVFVEQGKWVCMCICFCKKGNLSVWSKVPFWMWTWERYKVMYPMCSWKWMWNSKENFSSKMKM